MERVIRKCEDCGNIVEGKVINTLSHKTTKKMIKTGTNDSIKYIGGIIGASVGTIVPIIGNIIGGFLGYFVMSLLVDETVDKMTGKLINTVFEDQKYNFNCPNCSKKWIVVISRTSDEILLQEKNNKSK